MLISVHILKIVCFFFLKNETVSFVRRPAFFYFLDVLFFVRLDFKLSECVKINELLFFFV